MVCEPTFGQGAITGCIFSVCTQSTPWSEQQEVVSVIFSAFTLFWQGGEGEQCFINEHLHKQKDAVSRLWYLGGAWVIHFTGVSTDRQCLRPLKWNTAQNFRKRKTPVSSLSKRYNNLTIPAPLHTEVCYGTKLLH